MCRTKAGTSKPEDTSVESSKAEKTEKEERKSWDRISKGCGSVTKGVTCVSWEYQVEKEEREEQKKCLK